MGVSPSLPLKYIETLDKELRMVLTERRRQRWNEKEAQGHIVAKFLCGV